KEELLDLGAQKAIHHQNEGCITSPVIENARTRWAAIDYEKGWKDCAFTFWPEIERLSKRLKGLGHNHVTRDIKEPGECPRCDNYHNARKVADPERKLSVAKEAMTFDLGCGDNSCFFQERKGGMGTNGGCRCVRNNSGQVGMILRKVRAALKEIEGKK
ncbi:MAG: hypothetical protein ACK5RO_06735, partial [Pseudobdellovibrionaceae bacterium]